MSRPGKLLYEFHDFRVDPEKRLLLRGGKVVPLSPKAFDTLLLVVQNSSRVITKEELWKEVWHGIFTSNNNINVHISKIRKALGQSGGGHHCIETIEKQGYRFACEVREVWDETAAALSAQPSRSTVTADLIDASQRFPPPPDKDAPYDSAGGVPAVMAQAEAVAAEITISDAGPQTNTIRYDKLLTPVILVILFAAAFIGLKQWITRTSRPEPEPTPGLSNPRKITKDDRTKAGPLITDGARLYFLEVVDGNLVPSQVVSTGGEIERIEVPFPNTSLLDISPDQTELLIGSQATIEPEMQLWITPVLGGSPRAVGNLRAHAGAWSPDGRQIVYANGSRLYLTDRDGAESRELVEIPHGLPYNLRWSPDATLLRFEVRDPQTRSTSLWEARADGTNLHAMLPGWNEPASECCGNWTADGKYFVFQATRNQATTIWATRQTSTASSEGDHEPIQLIEGVTGYRSPAVSRDGKKLFAISEMKRGELVRYDVKAQQWVRYLSGMSADNLDFSSDGQWIVYVTYPECELWKSKVDGSERQQLIFPPWRVHNPRWSPDGQRISFAAIEPGKGWKIHLISAQGGNPEPLTPDDDNEYGPGWSPDGHTLIFWKGERFLGKTAIYLFDLKTKAVSELPGSKGLFSPRWSPKGDYIAALPAKDGKGLMLYDLYKQAWAEMINMNVAYPSWSRDGNYIYFRSAYQNDPAVFRASMRDRKPERWASLKGMQRASGSFGPWMGLTPDGSVLMLRDTGIQNIYAFDFEPRYVKVARSN